MKQRLHLLVLACAPMWLGCATVLHGTTQQIRFESIPPAATVRVGTQSVITPGELTLSRATSHHVDFEKPGYLPAHSFIGQTTSGAVWGNLLLGGIIGMIVDTNTGGGYELDPSVVSVTLLPDPNREGKATDTDPPHIVPASIFEPPQEPRIPVRSDETP